MPILKKIKEKPESERRKILWLVVFLTGIILMALWFLNLKYNFPEIDFTNFKGPTVNTEDFKKSKEGVENFQKDTKEGTKSLEKDQIKK